MLIECIIFRNRPAPVSWKLREYVFMPVDGRSVCEVDDEDLIEKLLDSGYYVPAEGVSLPSEPEPAAPGRNVMLLPEGAPQNLDAMTREQLFEYARNIGMRTPHPKISDEKLRANIQLALEARYEPDTLDEDGDE